MPLRVTLRVPLRVPLPLRAHVDRCRTWTARTCDYARVRILDTPFEPGEYLEQFTSADLSFGTYLLPAGGTDDQSPHTEDEIYVVTRGAAKIRTPAETRDVGPGAVIFVPAGEEHRFVEITQDLALLVLFAPPYGTRRRPQAD